jgi:AcrR family transcriptional regulator
MMGLMPRATERLSREEKKAMTRQKLLDAAATVFARKGFAGASLDDVADEAGLTKGAVYSNFTSKDDLIEALLEERLDVPQLGIADTVDATAPPAEQAQQAGSLMMSMAERNRDIYLLAIEFNTYLARNPARRRSGKHRQAVQQMADLMALHAKQQGRELPLPAYDLATALFALGQGIILEWLINPDDVPPDLFARVLTVIMGTAQDSDGTPGNEAGKAKR